MRFTLSDGKPETVRSFVRSDEVFSSVCCLEGCSMLHKKQAVDLVQMMAGGNGTHHVHLTSEFDITWPQACLERTPAACGGLLAQCENGDRIFHLASSPAGSVQDMLLSDLNGDPNRARFALEQTCGSPACRAYSSWLAYWQLHQRFKEFTKKGGDAAVEALVDCACDQPDLFAELAPILEGAATMYQVAGKVSLDYLHKFYHAPSVCCPTSCKQVLWKMRHGFHDSPLAALACEGFDTNLCPSAPSPPLPPALPPHPPLPPPSAPPVPPVPPPTRPPTGPPLTAAEILTLEMNRQTTSTLIVLAVIAVLTIVLLSVMVVYVARRIAPRRRPPAFTIPASVTREVVSQTALGDGVEVEMVDDDSPRPR